MVQTQYAVMTGVMLLLAGPQLAGMPALSASVWLLVVYLGLACTALPTVLQVWAQRVVPPYLAALLFLLEPVFANLLAFALLGERLGGREGLGPALIFGLCFCVCFCLDLLLKRRSGKGKGARSLKKP